MSRDIRSFFGGSSTNIDKNAVSTSSSNKAKAPARTAHKRTAITDEAERSFTPPSKRPKAAKIQERMPIVDLDSDVDSDPEEPMSSKYRKKQKQVIESDDSSDYFETQSASRTKASPKKRRQKTNAILEKASTRLALKDSPKKIGKEATKPKSGAKRRAVVESESSSEEEQPDDNEQSSLDEAAVFSDPESIEEELENALTRRGKKGPKSKEAGLQKIDAFATKMDRKQLKVEIAKRKLASAKECEKNFVDSIDFFNNFNKDKSSIVSVSTASEMPAAIVKSPPKPTKQSNSKKPQLAVETSVKPDAHVSLAQKTQQSKPKKQVSATSNLEERPVKPTTTSVAPAVDLRTPREKLEQWVDKYRPTELKSVVGQHTDQAPAQKLLRWLKDWPRYNLGLAATTKPHVIGSGAQKDGSAFRAALLSGPPGIGKTTTATLVCEALGLRYTELNASVARNKKMLEQTVAQLMHSRRVDEYFGAKKGEEKPVIKSKSGIKVTHVLIMDEVDGMSGNQDRAGIAELIQFIKKSEIPIICICNDRQSQKVRSLANYCFDLRFTRPRLEQIVGKMMTIVTREKLKITKEDLENVVKSSNQDMRQTIYSLQLLAAGDDRKGVIQAKDVSINIFEAARQILSPETSIKKKRDLFFTDYNFMPLFVQENYLDVRSSTLGKKGQMRVFRDAAESIAMGEVVSKQIRSSQNWSLLPLQGMLSSVFPPLILNGYMTSQVNFPSWFGKQSNQSKRQRLLRELDEHMGIKMSGPLHALSVDYIPVIRNAILRPLVRGDDESVTDALDVYHAYDLMKEDLESINELGMWSEKDDLWKKVKPTVKSSLTRALNKDTHKKHFATADDIKIQTRSTTSKRGAAKEANKRLKEIEAAVDDDEGEADAAGVEADETEVNAEILNSY